MNWEETKNDITVLDEEEKDYLELLARLVSIRIEKGISQTELAEMTGLKQSAISRIETQQGAMGLNTLLKIANALECKVTIEHKG